MDVVPLSAEELPLLGEPLPLEIANSLYVSGEPYDRDFLDDAALGSWWAHVALPPELDRQSIDVDRMAVPLRDVRDAVRCLLVLAAQGAVTPAGEDLDGSVKVLEDAAGLAPARAVLCRADDSGWTWRLRHDGRGADVALAALATACLVFLGSPERLLVRRCARPGCPMLFLQQHRSRRFCHPLCAQRVRQARYYRGRSERRPTS